jgi:hypothetical protein
MASYWNKGGLKCARSCKNMITSVLTALTKAFDVGSGNDFHLKVLVNKVKQDV